LGQDFEGAFRIFGGVRTDCLDKFGGVGDAFGNVVFMVEAMEGSDVGLRPRPSGRDAWFLSKIFDSIFKKRTAWG
jgi:hypothetical protein